MATPPEYDQRLLLPTGLIARTFGVTRQALSKWAISPVEQRGRERLYFLPDVAAYRIDRERKQQLSVSGQKARLLKAQAGRAELELKKLEGTLVESEIVDAVWLDQILRCRARFLVLPSKVAPQLGGLTAAERETLVRSAVYEALTELSETNFGEPDEHGSK